ncbi:MAG: hypothetical protein VXX80_11090, partial [Bacteroidota bacterium]|nr:hypothetical protein [Bacteroidota bacterium]
TAVVVGMSPNSVIVDLPQQFVSSSVGTVAFVGVNVMFDTQNNGNVPSQTVVAVVDRAGPTVIDVRTTTPQTIQVTFSEPLQDPVSGEFPSGGMSSTFDTASPPVQPASLQTVPVGSITYTITSIQTDGTTNDAIVSIHVSPDMPAFATPTAATGEGSQFFDLLHNIITSFASHVAKDRVGPILLAAETTTPTNLRLYFSEVLSSTISKHTSFSLTGLSQPAAAVHVANHVVDVTMLATVPGDAVGTVRVAVANTVKDVVQNGNIVQTAPVTTADKIKPSLHHAATVDGGGIVVLTFTEPILDASIQSNKITFTTTNGEIVAIQSITSGTGKNDAMITITFVTPVNTGTTGRVDIDGAFVTDVTGNTNNIGTIPVVDSSGPILVGAKAITPIVARLIFSEPINDATFQATDVKFSDFIGSPDAHGAAMAYLGTEQTPNDEFVLVQLRSTIFSTDRGVVVLADVGVVE